jgi:RNA polymerase sigma-70 factor, ECF subfamily
LETTDAELVRACLQGDRNAWEQVVRQHHQRIFNVAYRFTGKFDEAEDLTQEIFLKVYRTLGSYRPESGVLITWMVRVARNHMIDHYRKHKLERSRTDALELEYEKAEQNPARYDNPAQALARREKADIIHRTLQRVSPDLRESVVLRDIEELSYEEIAEMLKLPLGTVKSRINRGRLELARLLGKARMAGEV